MISGKYIAVTISGVTAVLSGVQEWTVRETIDQLDGTTGNDGGFENDGGGIMRAEIDLTLVQDLSTGVYSVIACGTELANLKLYRRVTDAQPAWTFPVARVFESTNAGRVRDRLTVSCKARSAGEYTRTDPGAG